MFIGFEMRLAERYNKKIVHNKLCLGIAEIIGEHHEPIYIKDNQWEINCCIEFCDAWERPRWTEGTMKYLFIYVYGGRKFNYNEVI